MTQLDPRPAGGEMGALLARLFDPGLTEAEADRIEELMAADPAALRRYAEYALLHAALAWRGGLEGSIKRLTDHPTTGRPDELSSTMSMPAIHEEDEVEDDSESQEPIEPIRSIGPVAPHKRESAEVPDESVIPQPVAPIRSIGPVAASVKRASKRSTRPRPWWRMAAAIVLASSIGIALLVRRSHSDSALATIINTSNARWGAAGAALPNDRLGRGEHVFLSAGWAEVRFKGGATVVLRAPTTFSADSPSGMTLVSGTVSATVLKPAIGFTVATHDAVVKDLGTEFSVTYDAGPPTRIAVFKGRVEVGTRTPDPMVSTLVAGQAAIVSGGKISPLPTAAAATVETFFPHIDTGGLPDAFADADIGSPGILGSARFSASDNVWTLSGTGYDIWNDHDEFNAAFEPSPGDTTIVCRLETPSRMASGPMYTKAGIMVRESLDDACRFVAIVNMDGVGVQMIARDGAGQFARNIEPYVTRMDAPVWFKLERKGNFFTGYCSTDGQIWRTIGNATIEMPKSVSTGLVVNRANALGTANFTHVTITH